MKSLINYLKCILVSIAFVSCSSDDSNTEGVGVGPGTQNIRATYKITFEPIFSTQFHPTDYPDDAQFIQPFIIVHSENTEIFSEGSFASDELEQYVEDGIKTGLIQANAGSELAPTAVLSVLDNVGPTETKEYTVTVTPEMPYVTFVTKISPSPDWFLGVNSFYVVNDDDTLVEEMTYGLYAMDAGTDGGTTYLSDDIEESSVITLRKGYPLSTVPNQTGKALGALKFERVHSN